VNRRRILAFLGLAPIVAATAVKAIASEPSLWADPIGSDDIMAIEADLSIDDDFWRSVQYCYVFRD
jgi:hypothetical protein